MKKCRLAIFASGNGSNAEAIIKYFLHHQDVEVAGVFSNNRNAYVLQRAAKYGIPTTVFTRQEFTSAGFVTSMQQQGFDLLVLAGFMWLVPPALVRAFRNKIINIHPALLPDYGGKGMYGHFVHAAVIKNKEKKSGITIHYVNERYDEGDIIFQAECPVLPTDTPDSLAERIHVLEHRHYPEIIAKIWAKK